MGPSGDLEDGNMVIKSLIGKLFGADAAAAPDAMKLDGTSEAALARSLLALPPDEQGWVTFAEARILFSTKGAQYAFGETDRDGRKKIESFAAHHRSVLNFMPVEGRVYFVRDPTSMTSIV
jgi:hypothetical protein